MSNIVINAVRVSPKRICKITWCIGMAIGNSNEKKTQINKQTHSLIFRALLNWVYVLDEHEVFPFNRAPYVLFIALQFVYFRALDNRRTTTTPTTGRHRTNRRNELSAITHSWIRKWDNCIRRCRSVMIIRMCSQFNNMLATRTPCTSSTEINMVANY